MQNKKEKNFTIKWVDKGKEEIENALGKLQTDDVIFMKERMQHIEERHPEAYDFVKKHYKECIADPDEIYEDAKNKSSVIYIKKFDDGTGLLYLRLVMPGDNPTYKNSIISGHKVNENRVKRIASKNKLLYKRAK